MAFALTFSFVCALSGPQQAAKNDVMTSAQRPAR
jgi:hypothetical protein